MSDQSSKNGSTLMSRAEAGDPVAQIELARQLAESTVPDLLGAVRWFRAAAEKGNPEAQYLLAVRYLNGQGVEQSPTEAVNWLRRAAEQGHAGAQDSLGVRYATGQGIEQNDIEALRWFRKAAEQGHPVAQFNLGLAFAQGRGGPVDLIQAYAWFCLSAEQGDGVAAGALETILESLTLEELRKARTAFHQLYALHVKKNLPRAA